jgi:lysophospholipase L1-like esterase
MVGVVASRLQPDVVILHIGLNDMHCMHDPNNSPVENRCHSDLLNNYMGLCYLNKVPRLAGLRSLLAILQNLALVPRCRPQANLDGTHTEVDTDVAESFTRQSLALVSMIKGMGAKPLLVPQVGFDSARISKNELAPWTPHLNQSRLPELMRSFNALTKDVATTTGTDYVSEVDQFSWRDDLFIDPSHLGPDGNKILATMISSHVLSK